MEKKQIKKKLSPKQQKEIQEKELRKMSGGRGNLSDNSGSDTDNVYKKKPSWY